MGLGADFAGGKIIRSRRAASHYKKNRPQWDGQITGEELPDGSWDSPTG